MTSADASARARRLASALEPVAGQVYFSPECHANYVALGFDDSPGSAGGVSLPDGPAYFTSRGSLLGQVPGEVVAAAFGVFNPDVVVPSVTLGWTRTDAATIRAARADGAVAQLRRLLGDCPAGLAQTRQLLERAPEHLQLAGRPLAAGISSAPIPDDDLAAVWFLADLLREYRGDSHTASWVAAGLTATEIGLLTERYWGLPLRSYSRTRGWTDEQFSAAEDALRSRGLLADGDLTPAGHALREEIELTTDAQLTPVLHTMDDHIDDLCSLLEPWGSTIRAGCGYLPAGPHDLTTT